MTQDQTRTSYDAVAAAYAEALSDELGGKPLDRALLTAFAEQVREVGRGESRVWDVGCGPGHVTAFLAGLGLRAAGLDLSGEMVAQATKRHPDLVFSTGSMTALPAAVESLTRRQPYPDAEVATPRAYYLARAV
jgi:predicted TPR repeat methyltransferase